MVNREPERKRLVELTNNFLKEELGMNIHTDILEKYADHLLNNGIVVPPCKVGQKVYYPSASFGRIFEKTVDEILMSDKGDYIHFASTYMPFENISKTVFLTREQAEKALEVKQNG